VLAGGESRRMGRDKAHLDRGGTSQLEYLYSLLDETTAKAFVSTRGSQKDDPERARFPQIVDRYDDIGPAAGILSALESNPDVDWLIVACDLPNVDRQTLDYLLSRRDPARPFTAFRSSRDDLPEPLCAVFRAGSDAIVRRFVDDGIVCPRKMMIRSDTALLTQPDPRSLDNVNTPDDLAASVLEASQ
jgi:molybdopterin-guanine dinucleotide biosynthesis protein A